MRRIPLAVLVCAVLLSSSVAILAGGQRGQSSALQPARAASVPFKVGETLTYDVSFSSYLVAGSATMRVGPGPSPGSSGYSIVAEARPVPLLASLYNFYYKVESVLDAATLLPQRSLFYSEEGTNKRTAATRFDRKTNKAFFELTEETSLKSEIDVPPQTQDGLSVLYVLRAMASRSGDTFTLPVLDEGSLYNVRVAVGNSESVSVPFGQMTAWNVKVTATDADGKPAGGNIAVWLSTDARHLPVKLQADLPVGSFVLALREAR